VNFDFLAEFPQARKWIYLSQWVVNLILGVTGVILLAQDLSPQWFVITTAAFNFVWTYVGLQAGANTPAPNPPPPDYEGRHVKKNEYGVAYLGALGAFLVFVAVVLAVLTLLKVAAFSWVALVVVGLIGVGLLIFDGRGRGRVV
jgi:hypothetical protein